MNSKTKINCGILALAGLCLLATGCATQMGFEEAATADPVGFWYGIWHGWISPISWIVSLFNKDVAIYAIYNNGGWYDFGYILGIGALGSGASTVKINS